MSVCQSALSIGPGATGRLRQRYWRGIPCNDQIWAWATAGGADKIETTLIAAEKVLGDFLDFNDFLSAVEDLLQRDDLALHFQMASFHPQYQFAGVEEADPGNYSNRAPYPVVQWLRTETVAKAVDSSDTLAIPQANIKKLQSMELSELRLLFPWVKWWKLELSCSYL